MKQATNGNASVVVVIVLVMIQAILFAAFRQHGVQTQKTLFDANLRERKADTTEFLIANIDCTRTKKLFSLDCSTGPKVKVFDLDGKTLVDNGSVPTKVGAFEVQASCAQEKNVRKLEIFVREARLSRNPGKPWIKISKDALKCETMGLEGTYDLISPSVPATTRMQIGMTTISFEGRLYQKAEIPGNYEGNAIVGLDRDRDIAGNEKIYLLLQKELNLSVKTKTIRKTEETTLYLAESIDSNDLEELRTASE